MSNEKKREKKKVEPSAPKTTKAKKEPPKRDITSYVTQQMLLGNISLLKIPREELVSALERYCAENPKIDATNMPLVGVSDRKGKDKVAIAMLELAKEYCGEDGSRTAIFSKDGLNVIIFGKSAKEIVSKISIEKDAKVVHLKTKIKIDCDFPIDRKLNCFGGERISDRIR